MPLKDIFSKKLRFSHREVTKRQYVLSSMQAEVGHDTSQVSRKTKNTRSSGRKSKVPLVTPRNKRTFRSDLSQSSPLVPLDNLENELPNGGASKNNSVSTAASVDQSKDSLNSQETPTPSSLVEMSYLASTPLPGKQQLRRQRPFTATREVHKSSEEASSGRTTRSATKGFQQDTSSTSNETETRSHIEVSQSIRTRSHVKVSQSIRSSTGTRNQQSNHNNDSLIQSSKHGHSKKNLKTNHYQKGQGKNARTSVETLIRALSEKRISQHRDKQKSPVIDAGSERTLKSQCKENRPEKSQIASLKRSGKSYNTTDDLNAFKKWTSKITRSTESVENENSSESAKENEPENCQNQFSRDGNTGKRNNISNKKETNRDNNQHGGTRSARRKRISSENDDELENSSDSSQKHVRNDRSSSSRKKRRISSGSESCDENQENRTEKVEKQTKDPKSVSVGRTKQSKSLLGKNNRDSGVSHARNENMTSSENQEIRTEIQTKTVQSKQKGSKLSKNKMNSPLKHTRERISSDSDENDVSQDETHTTQGANLRGQNVTANISRGNIRKQAKGSILKRKSGCDVDNDQCGPDQTVMIWGSDDMKRKKSDVVDIDIVLNNFSEQLESEIDTCESEIEQRAIRTLEKYLRQDITNMIRNVQTKNSLQKQVRKKTQEVKQKQTHLMSLQARRLELEESKGLVKKQNDKKRNIQEINSFIKDLQKLIKMC